MFLNVKILSDLQIIIKYMMQNTQYNISSDLLKTSNSSDIPSTTSLPSIKVLKKKKKRITLKKYRTGRWDKKEHALFIIAFMKHGNDWKSVYSN